MSDVPPEKPARRPRYRGTHPRQFHEKYKEHRPELYPENTAKVLESGKTPAGTHRPIMVAEILERLRLQPGETVVDCTLGYGGHARELLAAVQPGGRLIGLDADPLELPKAEARLRELGFPEESLVVRRMNYAGLAAYLKTAAPAGADAGLADAILADLGLSSMQIDDPGRGFTFKTDGPLDMRMNPQRGQSAAGLLSTLNAPQLAELLVEHADEPHAAVLAESILAAHRRSPLATTTALSAVIRQTLASRPRITAEEVDTSLRRVFQALRIAVNDEFRTLESFLRQLPYCLKPGGRVAILTFHSGEDRRVKQAFKEGLHAGLYSDIARDVIRPTAAEQHANPRSSPAKLRYAVRAEAS